MSLKARDFAMLFVTALGVATGFMEKIWDDRQWSRNSLVFLIWGSGGLAYLAWRVWRCWRNRNSN